MIHRRPFNRILLLVVLISSFLLAKEIKVNSKVKEVTIFTDRAMVIREALANLPKGIHTLIFSNITSDITDESVRINVPDASVKILDVKIERRFTTETQKENIKKLQEKIDQLKQKDKITSDRIAVLNSKKEFVESLKAESARYYNQNMLLNSNTPKQWNASLTFVEKNLTEIYGEIREMITNREKLAEEIKTLEFELDQISSFHKKNYKEIIVKIEKEKAGKVVLQPTYIVKNSGWYPIYDIRVETHVKRAELSYYAMANQNTGEDWQDVKLTLSTANPVSVTNLPSLGKWILDTSPQRRARKISKPQSRSGSNYTLDYIQNRGLPQGKGSVSGYVLDQQTGEPLIGVNLFFQGTTAGATTDINGKFNFPAVAAGNKTLIVNYIGFQDLNINLSVREKYNADLIIELSEMVLESETISVKAERPMISHDQLSTSVISNEKIEELQFTNVYDNALSTVFTLKTDNTIPSDSNPHKITLFKKNLDIEFDYTSIPKISPKVYLKGRLVNSTEYPLLGGELNVFADNNFINRTYLGVVVPSDTLNLALGIDDNFQIERILNNRFVESKGLLGGNKRITYTLTIRVKNNRKTEEKLEIKDQIPIAANENIKIEIIDPAKEEKILGENNTLIWKVNLMPGEEKNIPIKYYVEFPAKMNIYGLE